MRRPYSRSQWLELESCYDIMGYYRTHEIAQAAAKNGEYILWEVSPIDDTRIVYRLFQAAEWYAWQERIESSN